MPKLWVKDAGSWKQVLQLWVKQSGTWKGVTVGLVTSGGVGKQFYPDTTATVTYSSPGTYSYTVPAGITSLTIDVTGAGGGAGGGDFNKSGRAGYAGNRVYGSLTVSPSDVIAINVGGGGGVGATDSETGGGTAGSSPNGYGGGRGGDAGYNGSSGAGGGGGGATTISRNGTVVLVAGGGGGGGGAGLNSNGQNQVGTGGQSGTVGASGVQITDDGGGGGAGGGGYAGGNAGLSIGGDQGGYSGNQGSNLVPSGCTATTGTNGNGGNGFVSISVAGANYQNYTTPGSYSFVVPAGVTSLTASVYGAGGGAGSIYFCGDGWVGGGGSSGGYRTNQTFAVTPGETLTVVCGAGGAGGYVGGACQSGQNGTAGGDTYVSRSGTRLVEAGGGGGGGVGLGSNGAAGSPNGVQGEQPCNPGNCGYGYTGNRAGGQNGTGYGNGATAVFAFGTQATGSNGALFLSW